MLVSVCIPTAADANMEFQIKISFVEIYCERIRDLFDPKNDNLTGA